jgi:hypothetical protein
MRRGGGGYLFLSGFFSLYDAIHGWMTGWMDGWKKLHKKRPRCPLLYVIILSQFAQLFFFWGRGMEGNLGGDWAVELCSAHFAVEPKVRSIRNLLLKKAMPL